MALVAFDLWLVNAALGVTGMLLAGCIAMQVCRQPALRKRVGVWALVGCVMAGVMAAVPGVPRMRLGWMSVVSEQPDVGVLRGDAAGGNAEVAGHVAGSVRSRSARGIVREAATFSIGRWTWCVYALVAMGMGLRLMGGLWLLDRLVRKSEKPPGHVLARWRRVGGSTEVEIRVSDLLPRPVTAGFWRQRVLIPRELCAGARGEELDAVLLHEWAHVRGRDTGVLLLASVLRVVLFIHPLYWMLWRDLRMSQEMLADAWAAGQIGSAAGYAERLIAVSRRSRPLVGWMVPVLQAIWRRSELYCRMRYLLEPAHGTQLHAGRGVSAVVACVMIAVAAGGAAITLERGSGGGLAGYETSRKVTDFERRGMGFLAASQERSGGWLSATGPGVTALAMQALLQGGYNAESPQVRRALEFIQSTRRADGGYYLESQPTYNTAIVIAALGKIPGNAFAREIEKGRRFLLKLQKPKIETAGFYSAGIARSAVSSQRIVEVDAVSEALKETAGGEEWIAAIQHQAERSDESVVSAYGSLTYMQLKSLLYAGLTREDPRVRALVRTVQANFTLETNPMYDTSRGQYYFYYVASKALRAYGDDRIADTGERSHDWRAELVERLGSQQGADGSWVNRGANDWLENNPVLVTTYSVLALQEARR